MRNTKHRLIEKLFYWQIFTNIRRAQSTIVAIYKNYINKKKKTEVEEQEDHRDVSVIVLVPRADITFQSFPGFIYTFFLLLFLFSYYYLWSQVSGCVLKVFCESFMVVVLFFISEVARGFFFQTSDVHACLTFVFTLLKIVHYQYHNIQCDKYAWFYIRVFLGFFVRERKIHMMTVSLLKLCQIVLWYLSCGKSAGYVYIIMCGKSNSFFHF